MFKAQEPSPPVRRQQPDCIDLGSKERYEFSLHDPTAKSNKTKWVCYFKVKKAPEGSEMMQLQTERNGWLITSSMEQNNLLASSVRALF